tara:strand:- start:35 stop:1666 length:1632 start_codon:yes stop_codon:yes gene_type:complete
VKQLGFYNDRIFLFFIISIVLIPILTVFSFLFSPSGSLWVHLTATLIDDYVLNTLFITLFVSLFTTIIGVSSAWLVVMYNFPGKRIFKWLLVMPIAIPAYISAYIYAGLTEPSGFLFDFLDINFDLGKELFSLIDIRNIYGSIFILSISLYPYIYLLCYSSFKEQSYCALEVGKSLGLNDVNSFNRIALPLARPAIVAGLSLVVMESLAEFGTMDYYGVATFTTGIYRTWFALGDESSALHLAAILLSFVFILIVIEKYSRGSREYYHSSQKNKTPIEIKLYGKQAILSTLWCSIISSLGFIIPMVQLIIWFFETYEYIFRESFMNIIINSVFIASLSSVLIVAISIYSSYKNRILNDKLTNIALKIFSLGYSIPGVVIAVGIIIFVTSLDSIQSFLFESPLYFFSGSLVALFIAYLVRFSTLSHNATEAGLSKIKKNIDLTLNTFHLNPITSLRKIHMPMMKTTIVTSLILVFVDIIKELPATLILRPFNFDTLAINVYELALSEQLMYIASPSLMLIIIGLIPVIILINNTIIGKNEKFKT